MPAFKPYDKIIITAGAPHIPEELVNQLKVGGIMVIPEGRGEIQIMKKIIKTSEKDYKSEDYGTFRFVPLLPE